MTDQAYEYEEVEETEEIVVEPKDETKVDKTEVAADEDESTDTDEDEVDPAEELASSGGWVPEDQWKGNSKDWVDAREFNYRGELMKRIQSQSSQIHTQMAETEGLKDALKVLGELNQTIAEKEYKKAVTDLKKQRREAIREEEFDLADELEDQLEEIKEDQDKLKPVEVKPKETEKQGLPPAQQKLVKDWYEDTSNKWYSEDEFLRPVADQIFVRELEQNGGDFAGALDTMASKMKTRFPTETGTSSKKNKGAVTESSGRAVGKNRSKSKFTKNDLTEDQLKVGKTFIDQGVFKNMQEWVDQLVEAEELS